MDTIKDCPFCGCNIVSIFINYASVSSTNTQPNSFELYHRCSNNMSTIRLLGNSANQVKDIWNNRDSFEKERVEQRVRYKYD